MVSLDSMILSFLKKQNHSGNVPFVGSFEREYGSVEDFDLAVQRDFFLLLLLLILHMPI